jgi:hypothetical protein
LLSGEPSVSLNDGKGEVMMYDMVCYFSSSDCFWA